MSKIVFSRRDVLVMGGAATLWGLSGVSLPALVAPKKPIVSQKTFALTNIHTGESFEGVFWRNGHWVESALQQLNKLLRDRRDGKMHPINAQLFDLMHVLQKEAGSKEAFEIICGYRSAATNKMLKKTKKGIAQNSHHVRGNAIDLRLTSTPLKELRDLARAQKAGGVGFYAKSNFIHLDIRPKAAYWQG